MELKDRLVITDVTTVKIMRTEDTIKGKHYEHRLTYSPDGRFLYSGFRFSEVLGGVRR